MSTTTFTREMLRQRLRVLHLEDNPRDQELIVHRLRADGMDYEFIHARTRGEYEAALKQPNLDLIISDFTLPGYHGTTALAFARQWHPYIPFIFVSGTIGEERAVESLKAGALDYVLKDHLERLAPAIRRALRETADRNRRRAAEEALRESEERFRMVFESAPIGVINADANGRILRSNRTFEQMLGYEEDELRHLTFLQLTPLPERQALLEQFAGLVIGVTERVRAERSFCRKEGASISCQLTASAIWDSQGRFIYMVVLVEDLTERKKAEEQMRDQATLLDMADDAIIVQDADGRVINWNHGAERLYGWSAADVLGRKVTDFLYRDAATYEPIQHGLLADGDWSGEKHQLTRAGKDVIVNSRATLMRDESGNPKSVLVINTDITEKKRLEIQFLRAQRMENIGTLASGIAHDLNNILAPISIAAQILRMITKDKEALDLVDRIESSAHRGAEVVRQVLTFARGIEGERVVLQPRHLLKEIIHIAEQTFPKSIAISYSLGEDLWPVLGDATQLHQVFLNLCVNARDALPIGGTLRLTAENFLVDDTLTLLPGAKAGPYVLVQVKDSGTGIPPEIMDKIFEPFFTTKELGKGTGLGLSTVLGIVKSHGGSVNVYSEPGQGALFKVYLPAAPNVAPAPSPQTQSRLPNGRGELILLVDDEPAIRDVTGKILVRHGYSVLVAADGVEGVALHAQHGAKVKLVITDMMMPHMEGIAMIRALKKIDPQVKIIAISGLANLADQKDRADELKSLGITDFLSKPCTAENLLNTVKKLLA